MSFTSLLAHFADFDRLTGQTDPFGKPKQSWTERHRNLRCRLSTDLGDQERTTISTRDYVAQTYKLFLEPDVELEEADRVVQVRDATGNVLARELSIEAIRPVSGPGAVHHLEVTCEARRGSREWPGS